MEAYDTVDVRVCTFPEYQAKNQQYERAATKLTNNMNGVTAMDENGESIKSPIKRLFNSKADAFQ